VANDYTIRFENRLYQLDKPIHPGERGGKVVVELRLDGTMAIRFGDRYLNYHEIPAPAQKVGANGTCAGPDRPRQKAKEEDRASDEDRSPGVKPTIGRSGRTPAEPYPPDGEGEDKKAGPYRPAADHPWRRGCPKNK
jgi:hypothetical protein